MDVLRHGEQVRVLEPAAARDKVRERLRQAAAPYASDSAPAACSTSPGQNRGLRTFRETGMDLKVPITITDELTEEVIIAKGWLNLASGEIGRVEYQDYDPDIQGLPFENEDYEFTSGTLSNDGKDVEFRIDLNKTTGQYSVSATELLEIKVRAAALFAGVSGPALLAQAGLAGNKPGGGDPSSGKGGGRGGALH